MYSKEYRGELPVGEPVRFLHRMDSVRGEVQLVETDSSRLTRASFLDGREQFWLSDEIHPLELQNPGEDAVHRFIFHVGFCGSTLLARLLDRPGKTFVLKEPQCLADIAGQREQIEAGKAVAPLGRLIDHALGEMGASIGSDIPLVVKPTNWVNALLPELCVPFRVDRAIFVSLPRRDFLTAVLRGGRDRLVFSTRLAAAIAPVVDGGNGMLNKAIAGTSDPLDQVLRSAALVHALQEHLFDRAIDANGWNDDVKVGLPELRNDPLSTVTRARRALDLDPVAADESELQHVMERHAKDPSHNFSATEELEANAAVEREYSGRIDAALEVCEKLTDSLR